MRNEAATAAAATTIIITTATTTTTKKKNLSFHTGWKKAKSKSFALGARIKLKSVEPSRSRTERRKACEDKDR